MQSKIIFLLQFLQIFIAGVGYLPPTSHFRKLCDLLFIFLDLLSILTDFQQWAVHFILASCFDFFQFFLVQIVQEILKLTTKKNISNQFTNNQQITNQALLK